MDSATTNKFVRIDPRYRLRGWLGQPYAIVDSLAAQAHFVPQAVFDTLRLCNGQFRPSDPVFLGPRRSYLRVLEREGALAFSDDPTHIAPVQEYRYYPNHYMQEVTWSLTGRCNYRCRHCYMFAPHAALPQPTTEECLRIASQIAEAGVQAVRLTGGECLVRSDFLEIASLLLADGVQISTILTNGALLTEETLRSLREHGMRGGFDISFDGIDGQHDWLRGVDGAESAAIRAFKLCRKHGFPTGAQLVLHRGNAGVLRESVNLLGSLGVQSLVVASVRGEGEACGMSGKLLSFGEFFDICCAYLPQFLEDGSPVPNITFSGIFQVRGERVSLARGGKDWGDSCAGRAACDTIRTSLYLGPDGVIQPCIPMSHEGKGRESFPNIAHMTLAEALTDSRYWDLVAATAGDVFKRSPRCRECAYRTRCLGGCRAKGVDDYGKVDVLGHDPEACEFFLGGYYDRAREIVERYQIVPDIGGLSMT